MDDFDPLAELEKADRGYSKVQKLYIIASCHMQVMEEENPISLAKLAQAKSLLTQAEETFLDSYANSIKGTPNFPEQQTMLRALSTSRRKKFRQKLIDLAMRHDQTNPMCAEIWGRRRERMNHGKYSQVVAFCQDMKAFLLERHPDGRNSLLTALQEALKDIAQDKKPRQIILELDDHMFEQLRTAGEEANNGGALSDNEVYILGKMLAFSALMGACCTAENEHSKLTTEREPIPFKAQKRKR